MSWCEWRGETLGWTNGREKSSQQRKKGRWTAERKSKYLKKSMWRREFWKGKSSHQWITLFIVANQRTPKQLWQKPSVHLCSSAGRVQRHLQSRALSLSIVTELMIWHSQMRFWGKRDQCHSLRNKHFALTVSFFVAGSFLRGVYVSALHFLSNLKSDRMYQT